MGKPYDRSARVGLVDPTVTPHDAGASESEAKTRKRIAGIVVK
jgi:hypothetical protein